MRFSFLLQASWASTPVRFRTLLMDESLRDVAADNSASAFCVPSLVRMHGRHTRLMEATIRYRYLRPDNIQSSAVTGNTWKKLCIRKILFSFISFQHLQKKRVLDLI